MKDFLFVDINMLTNFLNVLKSVKKEELKIVVSIRDFPWDDPHDDQLKDWVNLTQNLICKYYVDKILVHGDPNILPLSQ